MATEFYVSVRLGQDEFIKQFESEQSAMECFDRLSTATDDEAIEGNWYTRESKAKLDSVTVRRQVNPGTIGDPSRQ